MMNHEEKSALFRVKSPCVFLHGFGSSGEIFRDAWLLDSFEGNEFYFIDGFESDILTGLCRWFPFSADETRLAGYIVETADKLEVHLGNLGLSDFTIVGHSQGAMLALELLFRENLRVREVWSFSGFLPISLLRSHIGPKAGSVNFLYSDRDEFVSREKYEVTQQYLKVVAEVKTNIFRSVNLEHEFSERWLDARNFCILSSL